MRTEELGSRPGWRSMTGNGFDPGQVAGARLFLNPVDLPSADTAIDIWENTAAGTPVDDAVQSVVANRPISRSGELTAALAAEFDGVDDHLTVADHSSLRGGAAQTWIGLIMMPDSDTNGDYHCKILDDNDGWCLRTRNDRKVSARLEVAGNRSTGITNDQWSTVTWYVYSVVYDGTLTGNANRLKIYKDGVQSTLTFVNDPIPATVPGVTDDLFIGQNNGSHSPFDGFIGSLWQGDLALDDTNREAIETWMMDLV